MIKRLLPFFLLLTSSSLLAQNALETRINQVESGLMMPVIIPMSMEETGKQLSSQLSKYKVPGASVAVINQGKIEWVKAYGVLNIDSETPVSTLTLFQCASIGKIVTGLAALKLVEKGLIGLDENVNNKLRVWKITDNAYTQDQPVTLRHLLSHAAGLTDDYGFLGYAPDKEVPTLLQILKQEPPAKAKKSLSIQTKPGTVERYSGAGYLIIQLLIDELTDTPFSDYVEKTIFGPIGMRNSTYNARPDLELKAEVATGHLPNGQRLKKKDYHIYPEQAAAGFWTTAEDLAKLIIAIQKDYNNPKASILSQKTIAEMFRPQINNKGLAVNLRGVAAPEAFWHAGQNRGYTGLLYGLINEQSGAVILTNSEGGEQFMQEFVTSVAKAYAWPVMQPAKALEIPQSLATQLIGEYTNAEEGKGFSIQLKKGELSAIPVGAKKGAKLYRIGDNRYTFQNAQDYYSLSFQMEGVRVKALKYEESIGKETTLLKK